MVVIETFIYTAGSILTTQNASLLANIDFRSTSYEDIAIMAKQWHRFRSSTEMDKLSQRLYAASRYTTKDLLTRGKVSKEELEKIYKRLYVKDPHGKRRELIKKAHPKFDKDQGKYYGHQDGLDKETIDDLTKRLSVADYVNRNIDKGANVINDNIKVTRKKFEASTFRLFVRNHSNRNEVLKKKFYDDVMNGKKENDKVLNKEEQFETTSRLSTLERDPAESNKELRGRKNYLEKGIYGTYAALDPLFSKSAI